MFRKILVALDNSQFSEACCSAAVSLAKAFGSQVVGCHVYAARMHERRFRQMEATLPKEYLVDKELGRQQAVHGSLIALGLRLISECYLDSLEQRCVATEVPFTRKTLDGKNWEKLVEEATSSGSDLVVLGVRGHGNARPDVVGSVCLRVIRRARTDTLVIKDPEAFQDSAGRDILVALDGSSEAFGALQVALALGKAYGRPVQAVAAYDPSFHYAVFHRMVQVLSADAARVFRFKEQEQLHKEIIDTGLGRLYQTHLEVAQRVAATQGMSLETHLLVGRAANEVLAHVEKVKPWLLLLGRVGVHSTPDMDIGSVTEHLLRLAPCNLLVASRTFDPPLEVWGATTLRWTEEAGAVLSRVPQGYQGAVRLLVQRLALEKGHTMVTADLVKETIGSLQPRRDEAKRMEEAALAVAVDRLRSTSGQLYLCPGCGHASQGEKPVRCPVCEKPGQDFLEVDTEALAVAAQGQGADIAVGTVGSVAPRWAQAALEQLRRTTDPYQRRRARVRVEEEARRQGVPLITLEFVLRHLPVIGQGVSRPDAHPGPPQVNT